MKYLLFLLFFFTSVYFGQAQILNLDPAFGVNGVAASDFFTIWDKCDGAIRYSDGRILLVGNSESSQNQQIICVSRKLPNGQPDLGFGIQGNATFTPTGGGNMVSLIDPILLPDGKIILAGRINMNNTIQRIFSRINSNGLIDNTFGNNGFLISASDQDEEITGCKLLPDGKLWCFGSNQVFIPSVSLYRWRLSSFQITANGQLDPTYSPEPYKVHAIETGNGRDYSLAASILADSTALVAGYTQTAQGNRKMLIARFVYPGRFDSTFGTQGFTKYLPPYAQFLPSRISPSNDGGILISAQAQNPSPQYGNTAVYRFTNAGKVDSTFGTNGIAITPYAGVQNNFLAVDFQEDVQGKIWVAHYGPPLSGSGLRFSVSRFLPNGAIDNSYGTGGYLSTGFEGDPKRIFWEADGFPILAGNGFNQASNADEDLVAVKVRPNLTAVEEVMEGDLHLYPTILSRGQDIHISDLRFKATAFKLVHASGMQIIPSSETETGICRLKTNGLPSGLYTLFAQSENKTLRRRFVVL